MTKRITLALAALGLSATAYAGSPADQMPLPVSNDINLTAPYQEGMWSFGVEALYWEGNNSDLHYVQSAVSTATLSSVSTRSTEPEYDWGWRADITYDIPGNGRDVTLSYTHFDTDNSQSTYLGLDNTLVGLSGILPIPASGGSAASVFDNARGSTETDYDAVDLTFGQKIDVGQRVRLHPFAGVRYASIDTTDKITYRGYTTSALTNTLQSDSRMKSDFSGLGPRFGADAQVNLGSGFMITGRFGASLLVGSRDSKASSVQQEVFDSAGVSLVSSITDTNSISSSTRVVPEMDGRLGIGYAYDWGNGTGLGVEVGYEVTNYFDVVDKSLTSYGDTSAHDTDFGMQGPYLRLQLDIA